jgi:hypothetical protein
MKTFLQDGQGDLSTMRLIVTWGAAVGTALCLSGVVAMFLGLDGATVAIGTGAGLFSVGEIAKAIQARGE